SCCCRATARSAPGPTTCGSPFAGRSHGPATRSSSARSRAPPRHPALLVFPLRFLRSMGYGGIVASTVAMLTALIVLPTVLRLLGARIDALSLPRWRDPGRLAKPARPWRTIGQLTTRYPIPVATSVIALLLLLAVPISRISWTTVDASSLPNSAQGFQAARTINRSNECVRNGGTPFSLAVETPSAPAARALAN